MQNRKIKNCLIVLFGIILNVSGRLLAHYLELPIWFDMVGTIVATYYVGLWGGIVAGVANNLLLHFFMSGSMIYLITSGIAAVVINVIIKRGYINSVLKSTISTFWLGVICTLVSTPLNLIFYNGYSGNIWGDTLVDMMKWNNMGEVLSSLTGDAVVEIIDKQVCVLAAYLVIFIINKTKTKKEISSEITAAVLVIALTASLFGGCLQEVKAEESETFTNNMVSKIYDNTNGMVSTEANTICETDDGYIWIGSYAGLTRYDGQEFEFIREGGLVNVVSMMKDSRGRLWIGTNDAGIARYENGKYTYFTINDGLPSNSIRSFAEDENGNIYVGTIDRICIIDSNDSIEILTHDITFAKYMEIYNNMLVVLDNKGVLYALEGDKILEVKNNQDSYFFYCMALTSKGLMAGTDTGELFVLDIFEEGIFIRESIDLGASRICTLFEDSSKRIWIALDTGFGFMDGDNVFNKMHYDDFPSSIVCFHEDYQGNIWAASSNYGVMKLSESSFCNLFITAGVEGRVVNAVVYYEGNYYCGTDDGLVILDGRNFSRRNNILTKKTESYRVRSLFIDSENSLWICTYSGLFCYDTDGKIREYSMETDNTTSDRFRCMTQLKDGTIVAGTSDGINYIKDGKVTGTLKSGDGLGNTQILSVIEGNDGNVWAGSDGSGIYVISGNKLIKNYTVEDGLSSNIILRIVSCDRGYLIVTSNALCFIDEQGNVKRLSSFPYFNNFDIILNGATAFVTCSAGLYEVKLSELCDDNAGQAVLYGANQGLSSGLTANSWNYLDESGRLFLCSNNGVIAFDDNDNKTESNIKYGISSIECNGNTLDPTKDGTYIIPQNSNNIYIYPSVRNYSFSDKKVRFFIKEIDNNPEVYDWDKVKAIQLRKPDFSRYHICMQILDKSGTEVLQESWYVLEREKHAWEQTGYKVYLWTVGIEIFLFLIFTIVSMIFFVLRKNELEKNHAELEKQVNEKTKEIIIQQEKVKDIFTRTVTALSEAVDAKDRYTSGHSKRVAEYALMIAKRLGKSVEEQEEIYRAGLLHDIGKIRVPAEIINKPGRLTDEEFNIIRIHPVTGYHILHGISEDNYIEIGAKYHHERYDGKGYPNGLSGERIPEIARILSVADAYDAMASNRSYRDVLAQEVVRREIEKGRGTQFDPQIADIMLEMIDEDKSYKMRENKARQKYILTIDDEDMNNKIIEHIMRDEPMYKLVAASGGKEALEILKQRSFDLILLDKNMPEMDGLETLKLIRESYQTPVVLMTSDKTLDISKEYAMYGCEDYITKPVFPLIIKEIIHNITESNIENINKNDEGI